MINLHVWRIVRPHTHTYIVHYVSEQVGLNVIRACVCVILCSILAVHEYRVPTNLVTVSPCAHCTVVHIHTHTDTACRPCIAAIRVDHMRQLTRSLCTVSIFVCVRR
jgi:hypothetical protein